MELATKLAHELNTRPLFHSQSVTIEIDADAMSLRAELVSLDRLGCEFNRLTWLAGKLASATPSQLKVLGDGLATKIHYLMEPIGPVELDADRCILQLRSTQPSQDGAEKSYYEMVVSKRGAELVRYSAASKQLRRLIPASVTRQVLERLVRDVADVLNT